MSKYLRAGNELPLNLSPGMVVALKSTRFGRAGNNSNPSSPHGTRTNLDLRNVNNDILLRITLLASKNEVVFNDRADISLLDGWGEAQSVKLSQVDVDRWMRLGFTISVHDCSTPSKDQYQILFDLTTIYYFDKRFPGPAINIIHSTQLPTGWDGHLYESSDWSLLSDPLEVFIYNLDDLPHMEKQAIKSGL